MKINRPHFDVAKGSFPSQHRLPTPTKSDRNSWSPQRREERGSQFRAWRLNLHAATRTPSTPSPSPQAAGGWCRQKPGTGPHEPGLVERGRPAQPCCRLIPILGPLPGPLSPAPGAHTLPIHGGSPEPGTSVWDSEESAFARHPGPFQLWALLDPTG